MSKGFALDLGEWFSDNETQVCRNLDRYFGGRVGDKFSGRRFEKFAAMGDPNRFEPSDVLAVEAVSVEVRTESAAKLLVTEADRFADLLAQLGVYHALGDPKDDEHREVPMPRFVMAELKKHISSRDPDDLVFGDGVKYLPRPKSMDGWFVGAVKRANVQRITPHDLRHTAASLAISAGANVLAVSRMLGHENPQVTLTYADLFDTDLDKVSDALDTARRNSVSKRGPKRVRQLRKASG